MLDDWHSEHHGFLIRQKTQLKLTKGWGEYKTVFGVWFDINSMTDTVNLLLITTHHLAFTLFRCCTYQSYLLYIMRRSIGMVAFIMTIRLTDERHGLR